MNERTKQRNKLLLSSSVVATDSRYRNATPSTTITTIRSSILFGDPQQQQQQQQQLWAQSIFSCPSCSYFPYKFPQCFDLQLKLWAFQSIIKTANLLIWLYWFRLLTPSAWTNGAAAGGVLWHCLVTAYSSMHYWLLQLGRSGTLTRASSSCCCCWREDIMRSRMTSA